MCLFILSMVAMFTLFNIFTIQVKNGKNMTVYAALLQSKSLETLAEAEDFPKDPWENESSGLGVKIRTVLNFYTYGYIPFPEIEDMFFEYTYPTTQIDCEGSGNISCIRGFYLGEGTFTGVVTKEQQKE